MKRNTKTIAFIVAFIIFFFVAIVAYNILSQKFSAQSDSFVDNGKEDVQDKESEKVKALDFTVLDSKGNKTKLSELFGKPIVLNFWASWCPPCKAEMPGFDKVYKEVGEEISFVMVDLVDGMRETMEKGRDYVTDQNFTFPVYYDTEGEAGYVYNISSIPTTVFIDKDGFMIASVQGAIDEQALREGIDRIKGDAND